MPFWFPQSTGSATSSSTTVIIEMANDVRNFAYYDLQRNVVSADMLLIGNTDNFIALKPGNIIATSLEFSDTLTAGEISLVLTKNGGVIADTRLDLTINTGNQPRQRKTIAVDPAFAFVADDLLGFQISTNGVLTPVDREANAVMYVYYSS